MKTIYVSHIYGGKEENKRSIEEHIRILTRQYPDVAFVSPVHAFGFLYSDVDYEKGMEYCLELLSRCDEVLFLDRWTESRGCVLEWAYAKEHGIPCKSYRQTPAEQNVHTF